MSLGFQLLYTALDQVLGFFHGLFGALAVGRDNVNLRAQNGVEEQVGPDIRRVWLHDGGQEQHRIQSAFAGGGGCLHGVVGLGGPVGDHGVTALPDGVMQKIFQFAYFIAAKQRHAGEILPLYIQLHPVLL